METYNKKKLFDNIYHLISRNNYKVSDIEERLHVSKGYLARTRDSKNVPSIEFLVNISKIFRVSTELLLNFDLTTISESQQLPLDFILKLELDTNLKNITWERKRVEEYKRNPFTGYDDNDIFFDVDFEDGEQVDGYKSYELGFCHIAKDSFKANFGENHDIYLVPFRNDIKDIFSYELWIVNNKTNEKKFIVGSETDKKLSNYIIELYKLIDKVVPDRIIEDSVEDLMREYLNK